MRSWKAARAFRAPHAQRRPPAAVVAGPVVNDLVVNHGWRVVGFALDQHLYCDIALQRRTATAPAEPPVITNRPSFMKRLFGG